MMTRTMKKLGATAQAQLTGSAHTPTTSKAAPITITLPTPASLPSLSGSDTTNVINPAPTISTNDIQPSTTITNDAQPSTSTTVASSSHMSNPLSMPLSMSMSSLPMSFLNVPLSNPTSLSMPLNMSFLNMPLSMSLSMPLNLSMSTGSMSTTLAPSESELGFGFQPQEEFSGEEGQGEEGKRNVTEREEAVLINGERPLLAPSGSTTNETTTITSPSDISLSSHSHSLDRPSSSLHSQSCVSTTPSTIPTRPAISICISEISQPTSNSSLSPTYPTSVPTSPMYPNPTSPTYSSPLKVVCFPPAPQQLPSLPPAMMVDERENRMKEWDPVDMNMADEHHQQQSQLGMEQGMDIGLSVPVLSFGDQIQGDELRLAQPQELEQEQDHSSLLGPAPQLPSPQQQASSPQLAALPQIQSQPSAPCSSRQYQKKIEYQNYQTPEWTPKIDKERSLWKVACKIRVWEM
ncbi:hypothetical protein BYT27DRAFT_6870439 [Phlegmacium glaucopus]|nr:hypothetical protein BYT27DRAFT_6870439 [Phlegmacium glaucopus]